MLRDTQELKVSTDSPAVVAALDSFVDQLLSVGNDAQVIFKAVETDPACVIANAQVATFHMFSGKSHSWAEATLYLNAAKKHLAHANEREQLFVCVIGSPHPY